MPTPSSSAPTTIAPRSSGQATTRDRGPRRTASTTARTADATRKRVPSAVRGGIDSMATAMARYVDPQTTYTIHIADQTASDDAGWIPLVGTASVEVAIR